MNLKERLKSRLPKRVLDFYQKHRLGYVKFAFPPDGDVRSDIKNKYGFSGDLLEIFVNNTGALVHKWHHYIPIYERYFSRFRGTPVRFLEIGVYKGGSIQMWRRYFGEDAIIYGIDIDPDCAQFDGQHGTVRIGSQADPEFLLSVIEEMGGVDIVLDDGSHHMKHLAKTLQTIIPHMSKNGVYMLEDLHTSYWPDFGGGYNAKANFFNVIRTVIDDIHHWYHRHSIKIPEISNFVDSIHIHDSIVVLKGGN